MSAPLGTRALPALVTHPTGPTSPSGPDTEMHTLAGQCPHACFPAAPPRSRRRLGGRRASGGQRQSVQGCRHLVSISHRFSGEIDNQARSTMMLGQARRQLRAARERTAAQDQCRVRIDDVLARPDVVLGRPSLAELIMGGDRTVLGQPSSRAPASVAHPTGDRRIQSRSIHPRLPAGNDVMGIAQTRQHRHRFNPLPPVPQRATEHCPPADSPPFPRRSHQWAFDRAHATVDPHETPSSLADPPTNEN